MGIDGPVRLHPSAVAKVARPSPQHAVELIAHLGPGALIAGHQERSDLVLEPLHAFPRRARAQVPVAVLPVTVWTERVAKKVEPFLSGIPDRGLRLVEGEPEPHHHVLRPRHCLDRATAAEDDEVVGIIDDVGPVCLAPSRRAPVLQETVHVQVGEQRACDPTLRCAAGAALAAQHAPAPVAIPLLDRCLEPHLDEGQDVPVNDTPGDAQQQVPVRNIVEVLGQIGIYDVRVAPADEPVHFLDCVGRASFRAIAIGTVIEVCLEDRLDHQLRSGLHHPVPYRRDAERPLAAPGLRDHHPSHRLGPIRLLPQILAQPKQPLLPALLLDLLESHPIHPRRAPVLPGERVGVGQDVLAPDLVVELVEAEPRLRLRLEIKLSLQRPDLFRRYQAHRQSPPPRLLRKHTRSQGPLLRRHYPASTLVRPCPSPARTTGSPGVGGATSDRYGLPPITRSTLTSVPCPLPRRIETGACVDCFPIPRSLPRYSGGSASATSLSRCYGAGVEGVAPSVAEKTKQMERPDVSTERLQQIPHWPPARLYVDCRRRDELEELASGGDRAGHRTPPIEEARSRRTCVAQALASLAG